MDMGRALERLGTFTAEQWGMVTSRQAAGLDVDGVTLHRLEQAGHVNRVRRGVYAATAATVTAAREEQAAWLVLNPGVPGWLRPRIDSDGGVVSHQSAARLLGLGDLVNDRITFTVPRRRTSRDSDLWFKRAELTGDDTDLIDGLPVTTALRTICDLLDQHVDGSHVGAIVREAVLANLVRLDDLAEHLGPYALRYGVRRSGDGEALLEHLLTEIGTSTAQLAHRPSPPQTAAAAELAVELRDLAGRNTQWWRHEPQSAVTADRLTRLLKTWQALSALPASALTSLDVLAETADDPAGRDLLFAIYQFMRSRPAAEALAELDRQAAATASAEPVAGGAASGHLLDAARDTSDAAETEDDPSHATALQDPDAPLVSRRAEGEGEERGEADG
jgi:predicted transcriptional regulator of viral defense system